MVSILEKPEEFDPHGYSHRFCNFADDMNGDGCTDMIVVDFPGQQPGGSRIRTQAGTRGSGT